MDIHFDHNSYLNKPGICFGNGPSINNVPDYSIFDNELTIGTNRIYLKYIPKILCWVDEKTYELEKNSINKLDCYKITRKTGYVYPPNIHTFKFIGHSSLCLEEKFVIGGITSSGCLAFQIAWWLGCDPIIIVGFDCRSSNKDYNTHFYGKNEHYSSSSQRTCSRGLNWIKRADELLYKCKKIDKRRTILSLSNNIYFKQSGVLEMKNVL